MSEQPTNRTTADWLVELCVYAPIGFALDAHKYVPEFVERGRNQVALARFLGKFAVDRLEKQFGPLGTLLRAAAPSGGPGAGASPPPPPSSHAATEPAPSPTEPVPTAAEPVAAVPSPPAARSGAAAEARTATPSGARRAAARPGQAKAAKDQPNGAANGSGAKRTPATKRRAATATAKPPAAASVASTAAGAESLPSEGDLAIAGYATLAASQIVPRLTTLEAVDLEAIGRFERANRGRRTILNRVDQLLAER